MRQAILALLFLAAPLGWSADDWVKVKALTSGTELKIWKTGSKQALEAKMDEATDESLIVATKKEQVSIPREQIQRIDARAPKRRERPATTTTSKNDIPGADPATVNRPTRAGGPAGSVSTSTTWGGAAPFETVYRKGAAAKK